MTETEREARRYRYLREQGCKYGDPSTGAMVWGSGEELDRAMDDAIAGIEPADKDVKWSKPGEEESMELHDALQIATALLKEKDAEQRQAGAAPATNVTIPINALRELCEAAWMYRDLRD